MTVRPAGASRQVQGPATNEPISLRHIEHTGTHTSWGPNHAMGPTRGRRIRQNIDRERESQAVEERAAEKGKKGGLER
jgi:hypothetical protein